MGDRFNALQNDEQRAAVAWKATAVLEGRGEQHPGQAALDAEMELIAAKGNLPQLVADYRAALTGQLGRGAGGSWLRR